MYVQSNIPCKKKFKKIFLLKCWESVGQTGHQRPLKHDGMWEVDLSPILIFMYEWLLVQLLTLHLAMFQGRIGIMHFWEHHHIGFRLMCKTDRLRCLCRPCADRLNLDIGLMSAASNLQLCLRFHSKLNLNENSQKSLKWFYYITLKFGNLNLHASTFIKSFC